MEGEGRPLDTLSYGPGPACYGGLAGIPVGPVENCQKCGK